MGNVGQLSSFYMVYVIVVGVALQHVVLYEALFRNTDYLDLKISIMRL